MSTRLLSPSHSLRARDEHKATISGDEHKATVSLSSIKAKDERVATFSTFSGGERKATLSFSFSAG
jgi:hypothetical protein